MDAVQMLTKEHQAIKKMFRDFEEAGDRAYKTKQDLAREVIKELRSHSQLEEQIFYPAVREKADKETDELVLEGIEEHRIIDFMMERLEQTGPEDETFDAKFTALMESVKHHLKEEDETLFPKSKKILQDELEELGARMEALEKKLEGGS